MTTSIVDRPPNGPPKGAAGTTGTIGFAHRGRAKALRSGQARRSGAGSHVDDVPPLSVLVLIAVVCPGAAAAIWPHLCFTDRRVCLLPKSRLDLIVVTLQFVSGNLF